MRTKTARAKRLRRKRRLQQQASAWTRGLTLTTGACGLIDAVGVPLLRLLAERSGLRSGLSAVLARLRSDFVPGYDRGQVLVDVAVALGLGAVSVAGATKLLSASQVVLGQVASTPTMWRALTELRPGNSGSNTATDHVAVLTEAVAQLPAAYRKKIIFRADGAGSTKELLAWIVEEAARRGYTWHYSVGFDVTEPVRDAVVAVPARTWAPALTAGGDVRRGAHVAEITGLLTLPDGWPRDMRLLARTEPLHPRHRKQASDLERRREQRFQVAATSLPGYRYPKLDAFHRNHAVVESAIKDGKDLGLRRLPGYTLAFNQAWCIAVAIACDLLAWLRLLALDHHQQLSRASPAILRRALLNAPARLVRRARRRLIRLDDTHPYQADLILAWNKIHAMAAPP